jgi:hypothetical protein
MIPVLVESPFSGSPEEMLRNREYLWKCMSWLYTNRYAPVALHALYPYLPDGKLHSDSEEVLFDGNKLPGRSYALNCNRAWRNLASQVWFFVDHGISSGMKLAMKECQNDKRDIVVACFTIAIDYKKLTEILEEGYVDNYVKIYYI